MFEVGQQVIAVGAEPDENQVQAFGYVGFQDGGMMNGRIFTVSRYWHEHGYDRMWVEGEPEQPWGLDPRAFRPVTRTRDTLSIESFMTIKTGQPEGPRRVVGPVSPKVDA